MADANARAKLHPLAVGGLADAVMNELVRHLGSKGRAMRLRNQVQHHVERGRAAGTGHARAIHLEQIVGDFQLGELLAKTVDILPMDGAAPVIKKAGRGHDIGAGADRPDNGTVAVQPPHQVQNIAVGILAHIQPGADKHHPAILQHADIAVRGHLDTIAGNRRCAGRAGNHPGIEIAVALPVGGAKRFDGRGEGQHRKIIEKQKPDFLRRGIAVMLQQ